MPLTSLTDSTLSDIKNSTEPGPVLFLLNALGIGGSERKTVGVVNELHRTGWDVHLAYLDARTPLLRTIRSGVPVVHLERKGKFSLGAIRLLRNYIRSAGIVKIVCVNLYPLVYAEAALGLLSRRRAAQVILMVNATEYISRKDRMQMLVYRPLMHRVQKVIFGCRAQLKLWTDRYALDGSKCGVVYNGIDENRFAPGATGTKPNHDTLGFDPRESEFIIGAVGTLWSNKNHIELIWALECLKDRLPSARLVIVGEGPERERLDVAARASGLSDRVSLLGEIDDVRPILENMDVFVLPSISETFSNAALEAMSMEKVVVLGNVGGSPEMVQNGVDGYCYERGNIGALAALLERLASEPDTRRTVGRNARAKVLEQFCFARMVDEYRRFLR